MAITTNFYPSTVANMFNNNVDSGDTFKMALLNNTGTYNVAHTSFSNVSSAQISGTGYLSGGATVTVSASSDGTKTNFTIGNATWYSTTLSFWNAVIYSSTTNSLIMHLSWDEIQETFGQDYVVSMTSSPTATPV